jgi:WD40 repeat protein
MGTTAAGQPAIVVRDVASGQVTHTLAGHTGPVLALAFSPDGNRLASGSADRTARVWNLADANATPVPPFSGHAGEVRAVAFSLDGNHVLSGAADNTLKSWNAADGTLVREYLAHGAGVVGVTFAPGGEAVSAAADASVRYSNPADGQQIRGYMEGAPIVRLALSRDGQRIAIATSDHAVHVLQAGDFQRLQTFKGHAQTVTSLGFSADNQRLVSASADGRAIVWETATGRLLEVLPRTNVAAAFFGGDANRLLLVDAAGALHEQPVRFGLALRGIAQSVTGAAWHPNGQQIYVSSLDGTIRGYSAADGNQQYAANHGSPVQDLALSPNGEILASAADNQTVRVWSAGNGGPVYQQQMPGFSGPVRGVSFSADGTRVIGASAGEKREVLVFDLVTSTLEQQFIGQAAPVSSLASVAGSTQIIAAAPDEGVQVWEVNAVRRIPGHGAAVTSLAAVPGAPLNVLSGSLDTTLRRWDVNSGQQLQQFGHGGAVKAVAVRPDGLRYASVSDNATARLWNAQNGQPVADLRGDVRLRTLVARLTQQQNAATARQNVAKQTLDAAEKDLPVKTEAEKKAAETLVTANKSVEEKRAALKTASDNKAVMEKAAIDAAAAAQKATVAKSQTDKLAAEAAAESQRAAQRAQQLATMSQGAPNNETLKQAAAKAQQEAQEAATKAQQAVAAQAAPTQALQQATQAANDAANKAVEAQKPYNDTLPQVRQAEMAQNLAAQTQAVAARELQAAQALVPVAKEAVAAAEKALADVQQQLTAAQQQASEAEKPLLVVAFSPDGKLLATGGEFAGAHTWDAETGAAIASFMGQTGAVQGAAFVSGGELCSGSADGTLAVWATSPGWALERTIGSVNDPSVLVDRVMGVDFSDDGRLLVAGGGVPSRSGEVKVFQVADGAAVLSLPDAHDDQVLGVAFSPDGKRIASAGADKFVRTFELASGKQLRRFEGHTNYVLGVAWKGDGQWLASCGGDRTIKVWQVETGDQLRTIENQFGKHVTAVRFIGDSDNLVSSCGDRVIRMHNASNGGFFRQFGGAEGYLHGVDITPGSQFVVAGGHDSVLRIWDGNNSQLLKSLVPADVGK